MLKNPKVASISGKQDLSNASYLKESILEEIEDFVRKLINECSTTKVRFSFFGPPLVCSKNWLKNYVNYENKISW